MKINNFALFTIIALCSSTPTLAGSLKDKLLHCASVNDSLERLVCYDGLVSNINSKKATKHKSKKHLVEKSNVAVAAMNKKSHVQTEKDFGADHIQKTDADRKAELNQVIFTISSIKTNGYGKKFITFDNGQKWKQTDSGSIRLAENEKVELTKGTFGVVFLKKINKNKKIKIKRVK